MSATDYDIVPYPSHPMRQTHPDRLAAIGILLGLSPAAVEHCRVLELGCGDGSNLIPLAVSYPGSTFMGIDLRESAIESGNGLIGELGLCNVTLRTANLLDFPADAGPFDFVIAHGLYSWAPQNVRDKIMAICRDHLAPNGVAYISYNAMPGGHIRRLFRDMMRFHVRAIDDPNKKIEQATAFLSFLGAGKSHDTDSYAALVKDELKHGLMVKDRSLLYHDDLAEINDPFYFHEFMAHASANGLQYLAESDFYEMTDRLFAPEVRAFLKQVEETDPLLREQYLDFLKCRRFRQTLLVRAGAPIDRRPALERLRGLSISSRAKPTSTKVRLEKGVKESFRETSGGAVTVDVPLAKSALLHLADMYPLPVRVPDLLEAARHRPGMPVDAGDESSMLEVLYEAFTVGLIEIHAGPPTFVRRAGEVPLASPLARLQLQKGINLVTTLRQTTVLLEANLSRELIALLDGNRDRQTLLEDLVRWAHANPAPGLLPCPLDELHRRLAEQIEPALDNIAAMGLLVR